MSTRTAANPMKAKLPRLSDVIAAPISDRKRRSGGCGRCRQAIATTSVSSTTESLFAQPCGLRNELTRSVCQGIRIPHSLRKNDCHGINRIAAGNPAGELRGSIRPSNRTRNSSNRVRFCPRVPAPLNT